MASTTPPGRKHRWKRPAGCAAAAVIGAALLIAVALYFVPGGPGFSFLTRPASTATAKPPQILVGHPPSGAMITSDDFSNNRNDWSIYYAFAKAEVADGELSVESLQKGSLALAYCASCTFVQADNLFLATPYYVQADFRINRDTDKWYGLVFSMLPSQGTYYIFQLNPRKGEYHISRQDEGWTTLASGSSRAIRPYPQANTLSVAFADGKITGYINGEAVTTCTDTNPLDLGKVGAIVDDAGVKLTVDNLFAFHR
jgi:hypothetical protein